MLQKNKIIYPVSKITLQFAKGSKFCPVSIFVSLRAESAVGVASGWDSRSKPPAAKTNDTDSKTQRHKPKSNLDIPKNYDIDPNFPNLNYLRPVKFRHHTKWKDKDDVQCVFLSQNHWYHKIAITHSSLPLRLAGTPEPLPQCCLLLPPGTPSRGQPCCVWWGHPGEEYWEYCRCIALLSWFSFHCRLWQGINLSCPSLDHGVAARLAGLLVQLVVDTSFLGLRWVDGKDYVHKWTVVVVSSMCIIIREFEWKTLKVINLRCLDNLGGLLEKSLLLFHLESSVHPNLSHFLSEACFSARRAARV